MPLSLVTNILLVMGFLHISSRFLSIAEKRFRFRGQPATGYERVQWSLHFLKTGRAVVFGFAAVEAAFAPRFSVLSVSFGLPLVVLGMALRVAAILSLGEMWSYSVRRLKDHTFVERGIYRYLRHPAYLGNIHIVGQVVLVGSYWSALLALLLVTVFYCVRVPVENRILMEVREHAHV